MTIRFIGSTDAEVRINDKLMRHGDILECDDAMGNELVGTGYFIELYEPETSED